MSVTTVVIAGLLALAGSDESETPLFSALDTNQNGMIDGSEVAESQQTWFVRAIRVADADGNDQLDPAELNAALTDPKPRSGTSTKRFRGRRGRPAPKQLDRNNDGRITIDEVPRPGRERFQKLLNRTGQDSIAVEAMTKLMRRPESRNMKDRAKLGKRDNKKSNISERGMRRKRTMPNGRKKLGQDGRPGMFERLDRDEDGFISRDEAPDRAKERFDRMDSNGDGKLSRQEMMAAAGRRAKKPKSR